MGTDPVWLTAAHIPPARKYLAAVVTEEESKGKEEAVVAAADDASSSPVVTALVVLAPVRSTTASDARQLVMVVAEGKYEGGRERRGIGVRCKRKVSRSRTRWWVDRATTCDAWCGTKAMRVNVSSCSSEIEKRLGGVILLLAPSLALVSTRRSMNDFVKRRARQARSDPLRPTRTQLSLLFLLPRGGAGGQSSLKGQSALVALIILSFSPPLQ